MPRRAGGMGRAAYVLVAGMLALMAGRGHAQEISVVRLPQSTDMTVRLENLSTHTSYEASGDSYFIVPAGRYSIQLLRQGQVTYQEVEYLSAEAPHVRTVNPDAMEIAVGLPEKAPLFEPTVCGALETAARLAVSRYGLHSGDVQRRLTAGDPEDDRRCGTREGIDATVRAVSGSYGATSLGMVHVTIVYSPLAPQTRQRNRGNSQIYTNPETQRLAAQPGGSSGPNLTPNLVGDLKNGLANVTVDATGKPLLVCGAIDANTPLFCDQNGLAVATPAIARLDGLYRFSVKTVPVDSRGVEEDHWVSFAADDEYHTTQQKLVNDVDTIRRKLVEGIASLEAGSVTVPSRTVAGQSVRYYSTEQVTALIATIQAAIDEALRDPALQPLRQHFPAAIAVLGAPQEALTGEGEARKVFRQLGDTVAVIEKTGDDLGVDLVFRTTPVETEDSRLTFEACNRCLTVTSQGGEHRFYRGRYYVRASRDGYLAYEGWLDLIDDPRSILECEMVRMRRAGNGRATSCSLKAQ